jgi:hypothetical protein
LAFFVFFLDLATLYYSSCDGSVREEGRCQRERGGSFRIEGREGGEKGVKEEEISARLVAKYGRSKKRKKRRLLLV